MENETEILSRLAANHLHLAQFEPLRAVLLALRSVNPEMALTILQTIVARSGRFENVQFAESQSCSSAAILTYLATLELLQYQDPTAAVWSFDKSELKARAEYLLLVQELINRAGKGSSVILLKLMELGLERLKPDLVLNAADEAIHPISFDENDCSELTGAVLDNPDIFDVLASNVAHQANKGTNEDSEMSLGQRDMISAYDLVVKAVQLAHLDAIDACLNNDNEIAVLAHIRYLKPDGAIDDAKYRKVLREVLLKTLSKRDGYGNSWRITEELLLLVYSAALSSNNGRLVQMIQNIQDDLLARDIENSQACGGNKIFRPLVYLQQYLKENPVTDLNAKSPSLNFAVRACLRDLYHYARVSGLHIFDFVMNSCLDAVKREQFHEANNVLVLFPRLRPLVAVMGWDLLSGNTVSRRKLIQLLWINNKSQVSRLEESYLYRNQSDEISCVDYLCDTLCYHLDLASFAACVNSGQSWNSRLSLLFSGNKQIVIGSEDPKLDYFVENFVVERLSAQSPLRVLFDVVPSIKFRDAVELIGMQPVASSLAARKRMKDIELLHMRYALQSIIFALRLLENSSTEKRELPCHTALCHLKDLRSHLEAIESISRKIFMVDIIISLLHMDDFSGTMTHCAPQNIYLPPSTCASDHAGASDFEWGNNVIVSFTGLLLEILRHNLSVVDSQAVSATLGISIQQALEWRTTVSKRFIEDWKWRLSILERLLPLSDHQWKWKEALTVLRAAPSKLLSLCMKRAKYDIGEEAVHRFSLSADDRATLELAEWVDGTFRRAAESQLVEDTVTCAADETSSVQDLDFSTLCSQLGHLASILLCIDVATTSARSLTMSKQLLNQAQVMLSEIYPGGSPKMDGTYWDQVLDIGIISVSRRVLKHLMELLESDDSLSLQSRMIGENITSLSDEVLVQGQRGRVIPILIQMIEDAYKGKRQFLSGKLHNLARAIADEESSYELSCVSEMEKDRFLDLGIKMVRQATSFGKDKDDRERLFSPISSKPSTYLSQFVLHIAGIGDIMDGADTTHDFNYFSVVYEWPKDLLTRLVFERGNNDAAAKAADIMHADFVHEVISSCVPPIYPPRYGRGWACIPVIPSYSKSCSVNRVLSPASKNAKPNCYSHSSASPGFPLYPLQLDIMKHLVKISPVRAVVACVFGSGILYSNNDTSISSSLDDSLSKNPDADRMFHEFALDQSERFPTLNRWIQMQTNLHHIAELAFLSKKEAPSRELSTDARDSIKRLREHDSEPESEIDDIVGGSYTSTALPDVDYTATAICQDYIKPETSELISMEYLTLDWENEELCKKAVERLIGEGKLMEALALSDRFLRDGASDQLLQLLIENEEENSGAVGQGEGSSTSWQFCRRLTNKQVATRLIFRYMHRWELGAALDLLTMCNCHLPVGDPLKNEVIQRRQALVMYTHILNADNHFHSWQEVEKECMGDPEGLALRLAEKGAVSAALEVAESAVLSVELRRELQGRKLVELLTADPLSGGGPAEASRFLCDSADALPIAMGAMQLLPDLRSKQLLVHFFLRRKDGMLSEVEVARLNSWALGLRVLASLPLLWQQRCSSLHEHPHLILEVLLMKNQLRSAAQIIKDFPQLKDDSMIVSYAAKAIAIVMSPSSREPCTGASVTRTKPKVRTSVLARPSFSSSLSNWQREARRAFSWAPRHAVDKNASQDNDRNKNSSGLATASVEWEPDSGSQDGNLASDATDGLEQLPSVAIDEECMLTGDANKDESVRASHRFKGAPDIVLFKAILSLCSEDFVSAKNALNLCMMQMKNVLSSQLVSETASIQVIGQAYHATEIFVQGLSYAKSLLRKLYDASDLSANFERGRNADDTSSYAGNSIVGSQPADELSSILSEAEIWLARAELLQSLLGSGIPASLDDIADTESSSHLRDRLIGEEQYSMAVYTCRKCKIDVFPVWNAWGHALICMEHYAQARVKFKQAFQVYKGDLTPVVEKIINTIEGCPPVDVTATRSMYEHLAKSAPTILDDSLSADSYLNVLYMPSTFPRSERSRRSQESSRNNTSSSNFDDGPHSNLDSVRYNECVNYLQEYSRSRLLEFMFRHGYFTDACMLFFPVDPTLSASSSSPAITSSTQKSDPAVTDYGTIDDLCDLCIGYGAMSVLEDVLLARMSTQSQDEPLSEHTAQVLNRICAYCESHRLFHYLYTFQVIKTDHVAAGLSCIQLFINSSSLEEAVKHLERAKMHFDEGLSVRSKGGELTKLVTKGVRGKSASDKLTEEGLVKFSARVSIQVEVVKSSNDSDKPLWQLSLFGNPSDPETVRRRCEIAERLVEKNFDLAFQVIYEFNLPAVDIYAAVAASLADRKRGSLLTDFFRNIKGTIDDDDWDQVLGAAINVYANKHKERPDRLIDMLTSSHRKVLACVVCGRLKGAFQIASRSGSVADVQYVAHQALHANALTVLDLCKQWLAQYM